MNDLLQTFHFRVETDLKCHDDIIDKLRQQYSVVIDAAVKERLVAMGWIPPEIGSYLKGNAEYVAHMRDTSGDSKDNYCRLKYLYQCIGEDFVNFLHPSKKKGGNNDSPTV